MNEPSEINPYHVEQGDSGKRGGQEAIRDLSTESRGNLTLTAKLIRIASVVCVIGSLIPVLQVVAYVNFYGVPKRWTWLDVTVGFRILYSPCLLLVAWTLWSYASALVKMASRGILEIEKSIEQQAKAWLALGLLGFVWMLGFALYFTNAIPPT